MGACEFQVTVKGKTAKDAFTDAVVQARYDHGHSGYSGTIAEKASFKIVGQAATTKEANAIVDKMMESDDSRICDKWGPAGCIVVGSDTFVFFGYASS